MQSRRWIIALLGPAAMAAPWTAIAPQFSRIPWEAIASGQTSLPATTPSAAATQPDPSPDQSSASGVMPAPAPAPPQVILASGASTPQEKREAALRLVGQQTPASRQLLASILNNSQNADGQLAVAQALATDPNPDPALRDTLANLVGGSQAINEASINALADYSNSPPDISRDVMHRLIDLATIAGRSESLRADALRALGAFADREAAAALMRTLINGDASSALHNAAADGLGEMTGQLSFGRDVQQWQNWWTQVQGLSPDAFAQQVTQSRATHFEQELSRNRQLTQETTNILADMYQRVSDDKKAATLDEYLRSTAPEIRQAGAQIVLDQISIGGQVPPSAIMLLRTMVSDSSADVRRTVAQVLYNDKQSFDPLLMQLKIESDTDVKIQIIRSIAPMHDLGAVDTLVGLLKDPSYRVRQAAADALSELGQLLHDQQPQSVDKVAAALMDALRDSDTPASQALRESCVRALARLQSPLLLPEFLTLLRGNESPTVHVYALQGLGALGKDQTATAIEQFLKDPDSGVRFAAIQALGNLKAPQFWQGMVDVMTDPNADKSTTDAAWQSVQNWFPAMDNSQLEAVAEVMQQRLSDQPDKELAARKALAANLAKQPDQADTLAETQQQIGSLQMKLNDYPSAADSFLAALTHWKSTANPQEMVIVRLTQQYLTALLTGKQYDKAATFASSKIGPHDSVERSVSATMRDAVEQLVDQKDTQDAQALITAIDNMPNKLPDAYQGDVDAMAARLKAGTH